MPYKLSNNTLYLFKECPKCFWLSLNKKLKRPEGPFPSLPSGMDNVLKEHFDTFRDKCLLPPELQTLNGVKLFEDKKLLETWRNNRKGISWADESGNILHGAVDNILQKGKKLIVLDYKTRGFPLKEDTATHYQNQLDIYNFLLRKNNYETEDYAYLLFYHPTKVDQKGFVFFHVDMIKREINVRNAEKLFNNALEVLVGEMPSSSETCGFCNWLNEMRKF